MEIPNHSRDAVSICECFCRDGLQHEPEFIATTAKIDLIDRLSTLGFKRIEATSYSNPTVVPQFSDASEVLSGIRPRNGIYYKATCANPRAVQRALADSDRGHGANEISMLVSASDAHSTRNLKRSRAEQWDNIRRMVALAGQRFRIIGTISVAFGCPFEGKIPIDRVIEDTAQFVELGIRYITLGDTTGMATPDSSQTLFETLIRQWPDIIFIAHFHDSRGTALANCVASYEAGVRHFDSAIGGVGGHPHQVRYGGGHTGNACTEDLVGMFESLGIRTGINLEGLLATSVYCEALLGRPLFSHVARSGWNPLI